MSNDEGIVVKKLLLLIDQLRAREPRSITTQNNRRIARLELERDRLRVEVKRLNDLVKDMPPNWEAVRRGHATWAVGVDGNCIFEWKEGAK